MDPLKIIVTGATGMVGEGVLLECLENPLVAEVLLLSRRHYDLSHPKLNELIVPDFFDINEKEEQLKGYDACFYCAGVSSLGKKKDKYIRVTYDTTLHVAKALLALNPQMVFNYVSGQATDSTEKGRLMWARVKGKTENDLMALRFRGQYNFRPGVMKPFQEQKNVPGFFKPIIFLYSKIFPKSVLTLQEVGKAMINSVVSGYSRQVLEVKDIKKLAK